MIAMQFHSTHRQRGVTLLESLVAIAVTALGVLGILGVQLRTLADTQTSVRRAQAIHLIENLAERMAANPNAMGNLSAYTIGWATGTGSPPLTPQASLLCDAATCDHNQLADFDLREWKRAVEQNLPLGDATVFEAPGETANENRRQLGVMISWRENEGSSDTDFTSALSNIATAGGSGATVSCPTDRTCHLQYIPVIGRCSPYWHGAAVQYFCAGPN